MTTEPKDAKPTGKTPQANVPRLMQVLKNVNDKVPDAPLNKTSITDHRGRRIELGEHGTREGTIYGEET